MNLLERYNSFYNCECAGLSQGGPISMEELQAIAIECMVDAFVLENLDREYDAIPIKDIQELAEKVRQQGREVVK